MLKHFAWLTVCLIIVAAQSGYALDLTEIGNNSTTSADSNTSTPATVEKTRIVTFGDSITRGFGATPYSLFLKEMLDAGGCNSVVINEGKNSETTIDGVERISRVLNTHKPHYILIMEGANDARIGIAAAGTVANLGNMMDKAGAAGAIPIVSAITPNTETGKENSLIPEVFNPGIANAAAQRGVSYVDNYTALAGPNWGQYNFDGLHMTNAGQRILATQFMQALPCGGGSSSASSSDSGGGGGCFIATAAFGSLLEPNVVLLRQFRDSYLLTNEPGRQFVRLYYTYSPPVADYIAEHETLKSIVRIGLYPLIGLAYLMLNGFGLLLAGAMGIGTIVLVLRQRTSGPEAA